MFFLFFSSFIATSRYMTVNKSCFICVYFYLLRCLALAFYMELKNYFIQFLIVWIQPINKWSCYNVHNLLFQVNVNNKSWSMKRCGPVDQRSVTNERMRPRLVIFVRYDDIQGNIARLPRHGITSLIIHSYKQTMNKYGAGAEGSDPEYIIWAHVTHHMLLGNVASKTINICEQTNYLLTCKF